MIRAKTIAIVAIALLMATLVLLHVQGVTGPKFWFWPMRRESALRIYLPMLFGMAPFVIAQVLYAKWRGRERFLLPLLMLTSYAMMFINILAPTHPMTLDLLRDCVRSPYAMSYYNDAQALRSVDGWLAVYPQILSQLSMHTQSKPAGPLLYFTAFIDMLGYNDRTAIISGACIGLISTFSIVATYWLAKLLSGSREIGFACASLLSICPGFILSFPLFDPCYILFSTALIGLWAVSLSQDKLRHSVMLGVVLSLMMLMTYTVLIIGGFLVAYVFLCMGPTRKIERVAKHGAVAIGCCVLALGVFWLVTGYSVPGAFQAALVNQHQLVMSDATRAWPRAVPFDLWDFALGSAWISFPLAGFGLYRAWRAHGWQDRFVRIMTIGLAVPLLTAATGLLPLETARVWCFQLPLLLLPAAYELSFWKPLDRWIAFGCVWIGMTVLAQNIWIVLPWA